MPFDETRATNWKRMTIALSVFGISSRKKNRGVASKSGGYEVIELK